MHKCKRERKIEAFRQSLELKSLSIDFFYTRENFFARVLIHRSYFKISIHTREREAKIDLCDKRKKKKIFLHSVYFTTLTSKCSPNARNQLSETIYRRRIISSDLSFPPLATGERFCLGQGQNYTPYRARSRQLNLCLYFLLSVVTLALLARKSPRGYFGHVVDRLNFSLMRLVSADTPLSYGSVKTFSPTTFS